MPKPDGATASGLGRPGNDEETHNIAAFYLAGLAAVIFAISRGVLPADTNPLRGYSMPAGDNDASKIALLERDYGLSDVDRAFARAHECVVKRWAEIERIADALHKRGGRMDGAEIKGLLAEIEEARSRGWRRDRDD